MAKFKYLSTNQVGLVVQLNTRKAQLGLTPEGSVVLNELIGTLSEKGLIFMMDEEHDLQLIRRNNGCILLEQIGFDYIPVTNGENMVVFDTYEEVQIAAEDYQNAKIIFL